MTARRIRRRTVIAGLGVAGIGAGLMLRSDPALTGTLGGADVARGHALRDRRFPEPSVTEETGIVIAGGGVAGLSAGWALMEAGHGEFRLLEMEDEAGGNARGGRNAVSAFPLGAHYLPVPNRETRGVRHLLERLGIMTGGEDGAPVYDPYQLCAAGQERLLWQGGWQEGLVPRHGLRPEDAAEIKSFFGQMSAYSARIGDDGRRAFAIPVALSSRDPRLLMLDDMSFAEWLDGRNYRSAPLRMHVRYGCRDDYGCEPEDVSAWAGIHYFASRRGFAANGAGDNELTWPEGNARLTRAMAARMPGRIAGGRIVHRVARDGDGVVVDAFDARRDVTVRTRARAAILAMPRFIAARIAPGLVPPADGFGYAPWAVANVTVDRAPGGRGEPLAWDNVSAVSESLGYVVATHQTDSRAGPSVLTWYMPLSDMDPAAGRRLLLTRPLAEWQAIVRDDLLAMNPDLDGAIRSIDIWRWGHAMIRPVPGFIWGKAAAARPEPPLFVGNSDMSGISIFEEAHWHGTRAAEDAMRHLGLPYETTL